jgi:hypothetical protein
VTCGKEIMSGLHLHDEARTALTALVARVGEMVWGNSRQCEGILRDVAGAYTLEISLLSTTVRAGIPDRLLRGRGDAQ